jgi:hypothetical protein
MAFCGLPSLARCFISPCRSFGHPSFVPVDHHQHVGMNRIRSAGLGHITNTLLFRQLGISQADLSTKPEHVGRCLDAQVIEGSRCGCREVDRRACVFPPGLGRVMFLAGASREGFQKVILRPNQERHCRTRLAARNHGVGGTRGGWPTGRYLIPRPWYFVCGGINRGSPGRSLCPIVRPSRSRSNRRYLGLLIQSRGRLQKTSAELCRYPIVGCCLRHVSKTLWEGKREMFVKRANLHRREATSTECGLHDLPTLYEHVQTAGQKFSQDIRQSSGAQPPAAWGAR